MSGYSYPQKMGRIILLSLEEALGQTGANAILRLSSLETLIQNSPPASAERGFSFEAVSRIHDALEETYGPRGGRGVALRVGRACFKYGLKEYGTLLGITEMAFRLLPLPTKLRVGAKSFAELFNKHTDQIVNVEETSERILWRIERCPLCWGRKTQDVACDLAVGLLQESLYWVSGGKTFNVEEIACVARGDPSCDITVDKTPLG